MRPRHTTPHDDGAVARERSSVRPRPDLQDSPHDASLADAQQNTRRPRALSVVVIIFAFAAALLFPAAAFAQSGDRSLTDNAFRFPSLEQIVRVMSLRDHNTAVVVIATTMLGLSAGVIGSFMLLRKRSLMADALSHATLPGIAIAFIAAEMLGYAGKSLPVLLVGALVSGLVGMGMIALIDRTTRLKDDAALGIVLSVMFGLGIAMLGLVQKMPGGDAAGLESFIYGKTASMLESDAWLIGCAGGAVVLICLVFSKELKLLCFDEDFAGAQGWPVLAIDLLLMSMVVAVTVVGLQAVGLILIIALLIIPPAAARFWTDHLAWMLFASALIGALSGWLGTTISALTPNMPAGAIIVVVAACLFLISLFVGPSRGAIVRVYQQVSLTRRVGRQNVLRAIYELVEGAHPEGVDQARREVFFEGVNFADVLDKRSWSPRKLRRLLRWARRQQLVRIGSDDRIALTEKGLSEAIRTVRNHRLWELYLVTHADIAPAQVDRDADRVEHILAPQIVASLQQLLIDQYPPMPVPASIHPISKTHTQEDGR